MDPEWDRIATLLREEREAREEQIAIERDRVAARRRAPPVVSSGGVSFPARPRR